MYVNGQGVPRNYELAVAWYRMAANAGLEQAQYNLGVMYQKGQGVGRTWARRCTGTSRPPSRVMCSPVQPGLAVREGPGYAGRRARGAALVRQGRRTGRSRRAAQSRHDVRRRQGRRPGLRARPSPGTARPPSRITRARSSTSRCATTAARACTRRAAGRPLVPQGRGAGLCAGPVQPRPPLRQRPGPRRRTAQKAILWYGRAGEQGHASSQFNLALIYDSGHGVARDRSWRSLVPRARPSRARGCAGQPRPALRIGQGVEQDYAQAAHWYRQAAEQGFAGAQYHLASCTMPAMACRRIRSWRRLVPQGRGTGPPAGPVRPRAALRERQRRHAGRARGRALVPQGGRPGIRARAIRAGPVVRPRRHGHRGSASGHAVVPQGGRTGPRARAIRAGPAPRQRPWRGARLRGRPFLVPVRRAPGSCARPVQPRRDVCGRAGRAADLVEA